MRAFGAEMTGDAMVKCARGCAVQNSRRRAGDEPVQHHRHPVHPRGQIGTGHRGDFAAPQTAQHLDRIVQMAGMGGKSRSHHRLFPGKTRVIDPGAAPGPAGATKKCCGAACLPELATIRLGLPPARKRRGGG